MLLPRSIAILLLLASPASGLAQDTLTPPRSVAEAVIVLRTRWLSAADQEQLFRTPKDLAVAQLHLPFGTAVRNRFHLWSDNEALRQSCGTQDPEGCSGIIFGQLWEAIRAAAEPTAVRQLDCQFWIVSRLRVRYHGFRQLKLGVIIDSLQAQVNQQLPTLADSAPAGCHVALQIRTEGQLNRACWARVEFSEDGNDPVSLTAFLGWFDWRNAFSTVHVPPAIVFRFRDPCAWPRQPTWFSPGG